MATCPNHMLPQMKSIWIDEDQEAEKLYGMVGQTLLLGDSDVESQENDLDVTVLNSDQPVLSHKKSIMLPPLKQSAGNTSRVANSRAKGSKTKNNKGFFKSIFKSGNKNQPQYTGPAKISTPFHFQHISHASYNRGHESYFSIEEQEEGCSLEKTTTECSEPKQLSRAFVTESLLERSMTNSKTAQAYSTPLSKKERQRSSSSVRLSIGRSNSNRSGSLDRSASVASSNLSNSNSMMKHNRVVSSSTIATSLFEYEDVQLSSEQYMTTKMSNLDISEMEPKKFVKRDSGDSELSLTFLKTYNFPTLLEEEEEQSIPIGHTSTTDLLNSKENKSVLDSFISSDVESLSDNESQVFHDSSDIDAESRRHSFETTPNRILGRRNSDTQLCKQSDSPIGTTSPRFLRSADDLLLNTDSPNQAAYRNSFF
ncbi:GTPase-interacting component 2 [Nakaseomyces bracarensis]|uniref:GTPase-interacting component 2 n=1 Tax=Nakaseomyces bracarensis TaxID=273131 RepID=A0ABR4NZW1_9SACH